ncbi:MAG: hypothetical protein U1D30_06110 [Planctomycetota bacterium]
MSAMTTSIALMLATSGMTGGEYNFKEVKPVVFDKEKKNVPDIWVLDFTFRNPRFIMVDVPGKGRQLVWYMTYKIVNRTGEERRFIPRFTLVTEKGKVHDDVILPQAEKAVMLREDPTRKLFNSVTISKELPASKPEADPEVRSGVAFFEGVDMAEKGFKIYVSGLSNGYVKAEDPKTGKEEMRRKTLELKFSKFGDVYNPDEKEIRYLGSSWIYR